MTAELKEIMNLCDATGDKHMQWFSKLIKEHFNGMVARAKFRISNGKIEGINNKIKTLRRQGYGYPDEVIQTMNISSSKSSIPAERSMSGTSDHTENVIEP